MAMLRCKMCGGDLELLESVTTARCEFCGSVQTVPTQDDDKKLTLFNRANRLRLSCEFDKAAGVFENIVGEFAEEAEAYWGLLLCKYGIEYVDDPATGKKVPTCHRSSFDSIMEDPDLELVMENADPQARRVYREEAKAIEELRKAIVEVSSREEPYDIFICYKETAEDGGRTLDSVLAQDIYDALTGKGYRVFFSRISLEDKLGVEYEPYIFAALNSAKLMLAVGTDYEYYNSVWVKNEWSRFLQLMAKDKSKHLIPCYKNLDAYDMPKEFAKLQAQDLGKVGAMQDLLRGVEKLLPRQTESVRETVKETVIIQQGGAGAPSVTSLLERAFMFLEDGEWGQADTYCDKVLDIDPKCVRAYLGKLLAELKCYCLADLGELERPFLENDHYRKLLRFADDALIKEIKSCHDKISKKRQEELEKLPLARKRIAPAQIMLCTGKQCTVGLKADGTVVTTGKTGDFDDMLSNWRNIVAVSVGDRHVVALRKDGTVAVAGKKHLKQCDVSNWQDIVAISAGPEHTVGLKADGTVLAVGETSQKSKWSTLAFPSFDETAKLGVSNWRNIVAISTGELYTAGLKSDGTVVVVGCSLFGKNELEQYTSDWRDIVAISVGESHMVGLKSDGTVVVAGGINSDVSEWRNIIAVGAGNDYTVGVRADGRVLKTGQTGTTYEAYGRYIVPGWRDVVAVSAGKDHIVGLKADGTLEVEGDYAGEQGKVTDWKLFGTIDSLEQELWEAPMAVEQEDRQKVLECVERRKIIAPVQTLLAVGDGFSVVLGSDGVPRAFGRNDHGQCNVQHWRDVVAVGAGSEHTVGLKSDGTVVATKYIGDQRWYYGQCNVSAWRDVIAISVSAYHTIGLKSDGTVVAVGKNEDGQCNVSAWRDVVAVSTGSSNTIGLKSDGTVVATKYIGDQRWYYGQCNVSAWRDIIAVRAGSCTIGLKADGTVVAVGKIEDGQYDVTALQNIVAVYNTGGRTVICMKPDGTVVSNCALHMRICSAWQDLVAVCTNGERIMGLRSNGVVEEWHSEEDRYAGAAGQKLFHNMNDLERERATESLKRRQMDEEILRKCKEEKEELRKNRQENGLCQHCGGQLKGLFSKKCADCGMPKDY